MIGPRVPELLTVLSGSFTSQPLAFAALKDAADTVQLEVDLADIDVIREAAGVRLAHYFRPQIAARIQRLQGDDDTVIVLRPSLLTAQPKFPTAGAGLRLLGKFAGSLVAPPEFRP
jgi:hypothetical protein